jgi:sugar-specific transcriptional regulator TrmB
LIELGFKESEAKIFVVLLKGGTMNASEIAGKAKITRTAVYDVLKSFAAKGYCNEVETNSILYYEIIEPTVIADKIERDIIRSSGSRIKLLKDTFKEFEPLFRSELDEKKDHINIELVRGFNRHREAKFYELFRKAKDEVLFMIRLEGFISEEIDATAKNFIKRGGVIRSIYEVTPEFKIKVKDQWVKGSLEDLIKICRSYESYGEQLKLSTNQLLNMTIIDREIVFTNVDDKTIPRHNKSDIIVRNEDYAKNMIDLFEQYWKQGFSIEEFQKNKAKKTSKDKKAVRKVI